MKISQVLIMKAMLVVLVAIAVFFTVTTVKAADQAADTSSPLKQCVGIGPCTDDEVTKPVQCRSCASGRTQTWKCHNNQFVKKACTNGTYTTYTCECDTYWKPTSACGVCYN